MSKWRSTSIKIVLALFFICVLLFAFSFVGSTPYTGQSVADTYGISVGQSIFEGDSVLGQNNPIEVPLISNAGFIFHQIQCLDIKGLMVTLTTGVVPFDFSSVSSEGIDSYGNAIDIDGPGYIALEGDKLAVKGPDTYVWGYSAPYKVITKTENGVDVVENGTVVQSIPAEKIKEQNWTNGHYNISHIQYWYNNEATVGSNYTLEKGIVSISDNRSDISSKDIPIIFGDDVSKYVENYPLGTPIVLYMGNTTQTDGEQYGTNLGSHPEYGDSVREFNARQFVEAWNGTVIPPNSQGNGHDYVSFGSAADENAPGGSAAHGVCPPARALRGAVLAEGFDMPIGMTGDENAVLYGYNPASDIKVTNNHDYPIRIDMWTEGSGTGMAIYAKIVRFVPNS
ncbi:MAG: hypothetical protein IKE95_04615 [Methanobrevibacter sp.]|nr:hypothetical protein [Methanobrevibacter sp.]